MRASKLVSVFGAVRNCSVFLKVDLKQSQRGLQPDLTELSVQRFVNLLLELLVDSFLAA